MKFILDVIKGVFIGSGAILPGISSGVFCVIFGIYEKLVDSVLNIFKDFKLEHTGSNKAFSFNYQNKESNVLHVFEAAIDLLSYMTLLKMEDIDYKSFNYLSLGGACEKIAAKTEADMPIALKAFLERNPNVQIIVFHLDNDEVGRGATQKIMMIARRNYQCFDNHPVIFKDVNEELVSIKI